MDARLPESREEQAEFNPQKPVTVLAAYYPLVHRIAHGLCASEATANAATKIALGQSLAVVRRWGSPLEAENWFLRHTVLASRPASKSGSIWIGKLAAGAEPQSQAFFRAFSALPFQQREAFLLTHGERLDIRRAAIAMDCSTTAVANHLKAATDTLASLGGGDYERLKGALLAAYSCPPPRGDLTVSAAVRRDRRRRWFGAAGWLIAAALLAAAVFVIWRVMRMVDY